MTEKRFDRSADIAESGGNLKKEHARQPRKLEG
jgi:hypothetical protein